MKIRILGCGTSAGVPRIGSGWGQCDPLEERNRRLRSSILLESGGKRLLVDCGPDLREQLLAAEVDMVDAVVITHDHADHCHGIDELRPLSQQLKAPIPIYARRSTLGQLTERFAYAFASTRLYPAMAEPVELGESLYFGGAVLRFVDQPHGRIDSLGMRIEEGDRSVVYSIDFNEMTEEMHKLYEGADVWICDCLSRRPHPSHTYLDAVLGWARELRVGKVYLSHMNNSMDYRSLVSELPDWAAPAHDGLEIAL